MTGGYKTTADISSCILVLLERAIPATFFPLSAKVTAEAREAEVFAVLGLLHYCTWADEVAGW